MSRKIYGVTVGTPLKPKKIIDEVEMPSKTSQLINDSNFATEEFVEEEIAKFDFIKVVPALPEAGLPNRVYFVPKANTEDDNLFDEYAWINNAWEYFGTKKLEGEFTEYVKKTDYATTEKAGVVRITKWSSYGLYMTGDGSILAIAKATDEEIADKINSFKPIVPSTLDYSVMKALSDSKLEWTEEEKAKALELLGVILEHNLSTPWTVVKRGAYGVIVTGTPTQDAHATTKKYVDNNFIKKLKPDVNSVLTFKGGNEGEIEVVSYTNSFPYAMKFYRLATANEGDTIQGDGYFLSNDPLKPYHTANKKYVDDLVGNIEELLGGI